MKKLFWLVFSFVFVLAFVACDDGDKKETDDVTPTDGDVVVDDIVVVDDTTIVDADEPESEVGPDEDSGPTPCKLEDTFFDAKPAEWTSYFTMKMSGLINDVNNQDPDMAFLAKMNSLIGGTNYNLASSYGMYLLDSVQTTTGETIPAVIGIGVGNLKWPVTNKLASLWAGQIFFVVDDLMNWKQQAELEGYTGVTVEGTYQVAVFEVWIELAGSAQYTRMECIRGISAINAEETAFEGAMFVCVDGNTEWAVGETMKAMDYAKLIDDPAEILAVLNEGLEPSDANYRADVCRCFAQDETIMDCDEMKAEFGLGPKPDEDTVTPDETEGTDDLLPDN